MIDDLPFVSTSRWQPATGGRGGPRGSDPSDDKGLCQTRFSTDKRVERVERWNPGEP